MTIVRRLILAASLSQSRLRQILHYDPETGRFTWLLAKGRRVHAGDAAGAPVSGRDGKPAYWTISIDGRPYKAHCLAWLYQTGSFPKQLVDHRDGDGLNNRWLNLRAADNSKNQQNSRRRSDNKSGFKGVYFSVECQKWRATIRAQGRRIHLGLFKDAKMAHAAYVVAAQKYFGEFARAA